MEKAPVVSYIIRLVSEASPNPVRGGQLAARVKAAYPEFNTLQFGLRNLREFIRTYIPEIEEKGNAGMDVIYGQQVKQAELFGPAAPALPQHPSGSTSPLSQLLANPRIWKTFASPDTPFRLFVQPSGLIRFIRPDESPDASWAEIKPISADALCLIAKDFIADLPESQQEILLRTLEQPKWWLSYFELLSTLGLKMRWILFRRRRIAQEFEKAVSSATAPIPTTGKQAHTTADVPIGRSAEEPDQDSALRKIASAAIWRMSDSELRALNLPLGYVIDALTAK
jgi:hypothetical protein